MMNKQSLADFCQKIQARLPELLWMLPYWPKSYAAHIPHHLFEQTLTWTPEAAIQEVAKHLSRLQNMSEDSAKARFLADKIARQINVLVMLTKLLPLEKQRYDTPRSLTRADYQQALAEREHMLLLQKQALFNAMQRVENSSEIAKEYQQVLASLAKIQSLMTHE